MNIQFYWNKSENNRLYKDIQELYDYGGTFKDDTSIINPTILIQQPINLIVGANYMHIESLGRYYYITDMVSISYNLTEIQAHVDVLMSFADYIKQNAGIVKRSQNDWNLYLNDDSFKVYQYRTYSTYQFPNAFPADNDLVLAVAGRTNIS